MDYEAFKNTINYTKGQNYYQSYVNNLLSKSTFISYLKKPFYIISFSVFILVTIFLALSQKIAISFNLDNFISLFCITLFSFTVLTLMINYFFVNLLKHKVNLLQVNMMTFLKSSSYKKFDNYYKNNYSLLDKELTRQLIYHFSNYKKKYVINNEFLIFQEHYNNFLLDIYNDNKKQAFLWLVAIMNTENKLTEKSHYTYDYEERLIKLEEHLLLKDKLYSELPSNTHTKGNVVKI